MYRRRTEFCTNWARGVGKERNIDVGLQVKCSFCFTNSNQSERGQWMLRVEITCRIMSKSGKNVRKTKKNWCRSFGKEQFSLRQCQEHSVRRNSAAFRDQVPHFVEIGRDVQAKKKKIWCNALGKAWLTFHRFQRNSHRTKTIALKDNVPNLVEIEREV